jgi:hypothetical protein
MMSLLMGNGYAKDPGGFLRFDGRKSGSATTVSFFGHVTIIDIGGGAHLYYYTGGGGKI